MRYLIAFGLVVLLVLTPSCKYFKGKKLFGRKADTMAVWQMRQDSIRVADSIKSVHEHLMAIENARLDSLRIIEEKNAWEKKFRYNIIVGAFITPQYAKDLAEVYRQRGYNPRILKVEGSRFSFATTMKKFFKLVGSYL